MRYTAIGTGTVALSPARVCAGHLVEAGPTRLLMDCGSGVTHKMAELGLPWKDITHVALTHFHIDHHGDLPTLVFAWKYGMLPARSAPLELIGPPGTAELFSRLVAAYGAWLAAPGFALVVREISPGEELLLSSGVNLSCLKVPHTAESVAYSVASGGRRLVYSGDTGMDERLADWASGCDLLVLECSLPVEMAIPEHLTPEQCGALAARAGARHLALTHFYPPVERADIQDLVAASFTGPLTLAHDGWNLEIEAE